MDTQNFLQQLFRSMVPVQPGEEDDTNDEMPPLEPIVPITTQGTSTQTPAPTEGHSVDATNTQSTNAGTSGHGEDENDSMPELQSVSDSSDEGSDSDRDANEVEMQTVEDDNDTMWTDDDTEMPGLEPINAPDSAPRSSNRRARVDEDDDEERDRRHPSQRVGNVINAQPAISLSSSAPVPNPPPPQSLPNIPPPSTPMAPLPRIRATINIPGFLGNAGGPDPFRIFQQRLFQQNRGGPGQPNAPNNNALPGNPGMPPVFSGFAITLDLNGTPVLHHHPADPNGQDFAAFRDFAGLFGLGFPMQEVEDPERAKRLIAGLEEVPIGLVRRLERIGGSGNAEEEVGGSGGDSGCAICWDRLLDGEGDGFGMTEKKDEIKESESATPNLPADEATSTSIHGDEATPTSTTPEEAKEPTQPKIVSLPCAHVFHASCLIPWFSRPNQTTCPTCRFNIDPENLTYVRRPRPAAPPRSTSASTQAPTDPNTTAPAPGTGAAAQPNANATPAPAPGPFGNFGGGALFADVIQFPNHPQPNNTTLNAVENLGNEATTAADPAATEAAELAAVRESIAQRDRDMARERSEALAALLGVLPATGASPTAPQVNAVAGSSTEDDIPLPLVENDQEEHPNPPLPDIGGAPTSTTTIPNTTLPAQPQPQPLGTNLNPNNRNGLGTIHWGFDIFVGAIPPGMDVDDEDFMMDDDMMDHEMEGAWGAALQGNDGDFNMPPPEPLQPTTDAAPTNEAGNAPPPIPPPPTGATGNGPQGPFGPFPHPMFPGLNTGRGVHVGVGTARTVNDAFANLFGRRGLFGAPSTQGTPTTASGPGTGAGPQAIPTPTGEAAPTNAPPNTNSSAQANAAPTNPQPMPDFFSAMLNSIPVGALGRIVPMPLAQPFPANVVGNSMAPAPASAGANAEPQIPGDLNGQAGVNLPPLRQNDTPPAPAPSGTTAPTNGPIPAGPQPQNALPPFANLFGAFPPGFQTGPPRQRDGNTPPHPSFMPRAPRERKAWTLPPAPGPSLRQRIERREREAGLRCYDVSCGVGPSDEDPLIALTEAAMKQLEIRPHGPSDTDGPPVCRHTFHSPCLVSSERVLLKGGEVTVVGDNVEVSCSICRGVGCVSKADWDEGVQALA